MRFEKITIADSQVQLDGNEYDDVEFSNCSLVYSGGIPPLMGKVTFKGCRFGFAGAADNMLKFLGRLYNSGAREFVEEVFDHIRLET